MVCKFCNAEMFEEELICPHCGRCQDEESFPTEKSLPQEVPITAEESLAAEEPPVQQKKDTWKLVLLIAGFVAAACVLAMVLLKEFDIELFPSEDILRKETYAVAAEQMVSQADKVVATFGDKEMDNALLQVFYVDEFDAFLSDSYSYLSQIGLDLQKPLSKQTCYFDDTMTWEQFVLQRSLETWQNYMLMGILADQEDFALNDEWQQALDGMLQQMETDAKKNGYESADAQLKERYGESCSTTVYMEYVALIFKANAYYAAKYGVTDAEIEAEFTAHEAEFAEKGITKSSALVSAVRHILIAPEGEAATDAAGQKTYTDQQWADCLKKAEQVLQEWKNGAATAQSFQELVSKYTADTASISTGGLYEGIARDSIYMESFRDWAVDTARTAGETGLVQTEAGYHIMYFVEGEPEWIYYSRKQLQDQRFEDMQSRMETVIEGNPIKIHYSKIAVREPLTK